MVGAVPAYVPATALAFDGNKKKKKKAKKDRTYDCRETKKGRCTGNCGKCLYKLEKQEKKKAKKANFGAHLSVMV